MNRRQMLLCNLLIVLFISVGFLGMLYLDTHTYQNMADEQVSNVVQLSQNDISKEIENALTKPLTVSRTMANDEFLKRWILEEKSQKNDADFLNQIYQFLQTYQKKNGYNTVFFVSAQTGNYYYQEGLNKTISVEDPHDIWYYNFVDGGKEYDIQIDTDQSNGDNITIFVNFRVEDSNGNLLGVIGVGQELSDLMTLIKSYATNYDLSVFIINDSGAENSFHQNTGLFVKREELSDLLGITGALTLEPDMDSTEQWFSEGRAKRCIITKYEPVLQWYLILEKNMAPLYDHFYNQFYKSILFLLLSLTACVTLTTIVFQQHNRRLIQAENTDELTGLANPRLFTQQMEAILKKMLTAVHFLLDIDRFKQINDNYGHLSGNEVLSFFGKELQLAVKKYGICGRWGGDEFIGLLRIDQKQTEKILLELQRRLDEEKHRLPCPITFSAGTTQVTKEAAPEELLQRADQALYHAKETGRGKTSHS